MFAKFRIRKNKPEQPASETDMSISGINSALNIASLVGGVLRSATGSQQVSNSAAELKIRRNRPSSEVAKLLPSGGLSEIEAGTIRRLRPGVARSRRDL